MLFADDLSLHFSQTRGLADHAKQTSWEYTLKRSLSLSTHRSGNSNSENLPPLYFDGVMLPYTEKKRINYAGSENHSPH
jgi:hypothetical protein